MQYSECCKSYLKGNNRSLKLYVCAFAGTLNMKHKLFGWDDNMYVVALFPLGYPDEIPEARKHLSLQNIIVEKSYKSLLLGVVLLG